MNSATVLGMSTEEPRPPSTPRSESESEGVIPELIRKAISTGVRGVLKSEENIRNIAGDILNNETLGNVTGSVGSTLTAAREEVVRVVGQEVVKYLEKMNLDEEIVKVLTSISLELKTEIRFIPNDQKLVTPEIKTKTRVKKTRSGTKKRSVRKKTDS
jgi:hypothetical protein